MPLCYIAVYILCVIPPYKTSFVVCLFFFLFFCVCVCVCVCVCRFLFFFLKEMNHISFQYLLFKSFNFLFKMCFYICI